MYARAIYSLAIACPKLRPLRGTYLTIAFNYIVPLSFYLYALSILRPFFIKNNLVQQINFFKHDCL